MLRLLDLHSCGYEYTVSSWVSQKGNVYAAELKNADVLLDRCISDCYPRRRSSVMMKAEDALFAIRKPAESSRRSLSQRWE